MKKNIKLHSRKRLKSLIIRGLKNNNVYRINLLILIAILTIMVVKRIFMKKRLDFLLSFFSNISLLSHVPVNRVLCLWFTR